MLTRKISQLLGGIVIVFLGLFNALVEESREQALGLLAAASLHLEEVIDDFLRDLLGLFRCPPLGGDGNKVRIPSILDDEVRFSEGCSVGLLLGGFALVELIDDRVEDGARLHELHVVAFVAQHGLKLVVNHYLSTARLHESRRLVLLRQAEGDDCCDSRAGNDDADDDVLVGFHDLPELAEVYVFFFL